MESECGRPATYASMVMLFHLEQWQRLCTQTQSTCRNYLSLQFLCYSYIFRFCFVHLCSLISARFGRLFFLLFQKQVNYGKEALNRVVCNGIRDDTICYDVTRYEINSNIWLVRSAAACYSALLNAKQSLKVLTPLPCLLLQSQIEFSHSRAYNTRDKRTKRQKITLRTKIITWMKIRLRVPVEKMFCLFTFHTEISLATQVNCFFLE